MSDIALMFPISVWGFVKWEFVVYVFTNLCIHDSTDDENVVLRNATNKLVIEGDEVRFVNNIGRAVVRDDSRVGVAIKYGHHRPRLCFLDAI